MTTEAYIFDAVRTPRGRGKKDGSLHSVKPRQTTGDVPGLRAFLRNTGDHITQLDLGTIRHGYQSVGRQDPAPVTLRPYCATG